MSNSEQIAALEVRFREMPSGLTLIEEIRWLYALRKEARELETWIEQEKREKGMQPTA